LPISGTKRVKYLEENPGPQEVALSRDDLAMIDEVFSRCGGGCALHGRMDARIARLIVIA